MSSRSSVIKNSLCRKIEDNGFVMVFPCERCLRLKRSCIKLEGSSRCSECVKANGCKCVDSKMSFSDSEWRRLVAAQNKIEEDEELLLNKLIRLRKQKRLLKQRAGDFIARDYKEIADLERLEEEERKQKEIEEAQKSRSATVSNGESSSQAAFDAEAAEAFALPSLSDPFFDYLHAEIPESFQGSPSA